MGCYLDPDNESKEAYLEREGREVESDYISNNYKDIKQKGSLPVVLVDNGNFTAAGIAYTEREFERFVRYDNRPKRFFIVSIERLSKDVPIVKEYLKIAEEEWRNRYN